ncbi:hypothetical protein ACVOMT_17540 [Sphingomonas panni]
MKRLAWAALMVSGVAVAQAPAPTPQAPAIDRTILHAQVLLDRHGFTTGVIDGKDSALFKKRCAGSRPRAACPSRASSMPPPPAR